MAADRPREELARMVASYGREIASDPRRCEGLLRDTCGSCDREIFILASVQKKRIPGELLALAPSVPKELLVKRLAERAVKELGFAPEHALWAVVSWALALGVITPEDARSLERKAGKRRAGTAGAPAAPVAPAPGFPPESIIVSPGRDGQFRTIADAVGRAIPGARIFVRPGTYREALRIERPVEIIGEGPAAGIVLEGTGGPLVQSKADTLSLHGLSLNGQAGEGAGAPLVEILRGTALIEDCTLSTGSTGLALAGNKARGILRRLSLHGFRTSAVMVSGRASAQMNGCTVASSRSGITVTDGSEVGIRGCHIEGGSYGIEFGSRSGGIVEGSEITKYAYAGVLIRDGADPGVQGCSVHHGNFGIEVSDRGKGVITDCDIAGNARGFFITRSGNPVVQRCIIHDGQFGVGASEKGKGSFEECRITGNLYAGVSSRGGAHPRLLRCQVTGNRDVGVWVYEKAMATVEGCDLTGNTRGPFTVEAGSRLTRKDTREG
jgi:nitrous oxidase accessory protein NosD